MWVGTVHDGIAWPSDTTASVAIVGGGLAGIGAARRLHERGISFVLFEAEGRLGGRVKPVPYYDGFLQHGAEYINGTANPMYKLAESLGIVGELVRDYEYIKMPTSFGSCNVKMKDVEEFYKFADVLEAKYMAMADNTSDTKVSVGELFEKDYEMFIKTGDRLARKNVFDSLARRYRRYYENEWASPADELALQNYRQYDDGTNIRASYCLGKRGFQAILEQILLDFPLGRVRFNSRVVNVDYSGSKVRLTLLNGSLAEPFDAVIITVPLGHLKRFHHSLFTPSLPKSKIQAIKNLGFGHMSKVFFEYEKPFWSPSTTGVLPIRIDGYHKPSPLREAFGNLQPLSWRNNVLVTVLSYQGTLLVDQTDDAQISKEVTAHLREMLLDSSIPEPQRIIRNRWSTNELYLGSYSYLTPAAVNDSRDAFADMASPIIVAKKLRVLFAGEATHSTLFQTTSGAFLSGEREADRIKKFIDEFGYRANREDRRLSRL